MINASGCVRTGDTHVSHGETLHLDLVGLALVRELSGRPAVPNADGYGATFQFDIGIGCVLWLSHAQEAQHGDRCQHTDRSRSHFDPSLSFLVRLAFAP